MPELSQAPRSQAAATYDVTAVRYATVTSSKGELYYRYATYDEPDADVTMSYYFWVLQGASETVLVDCGFSPSVGTRRGRTCLVEPVEAIRELGVDPAAVEHVVVSHFHYDHVGNLGAFPNAELIVPRSELDFWSSSVAAHPQFASHVERADLELISGAGDRLRVIDGEREVLPGIAMIPVGGHSPGQTLIVVETGGAPVLLTSDAVHFYEELERDRPFSVIADLPAMYGAYDRIRELAKERNAVVVPGHDPAVADRLPSDAAAAGIHCQVFNPDQ